MSKSVLEKRSLTLEDELNSDPDMAKQPRTCPKKTLVFIRHGESEYNRAMKETGEDPMIRDALLTDKGRSQARKAREVLAAIRRELEAKNPAAKGCWLMASSPLKRALYTASEVWPEAFWQGAAGEEGDRGTCENVRFEIVPELREVITGCDDLGSTPGELRGLFPHLGRQLGALPTVWWSVPEECRHLSPEGGAMREAYGDCPEPWEDADEEGLEERLEHAIEHVAEAPEQFVVLVAHCDLIRSLTKKLGLTEGGRKGWSLKNCECRLAEGVELRAASERAACGSCKTCLPC